jgi:zona occludens toxin (predicted ATPase)
MALSIYVGPPGSGKTYTAVESIAIPAAKAGRTIITNIKGINPEVWAERFFIEPEKIRRWVSQFLTEFRPGRSC